MLVVVLENRNKLKFNDFTCVTNWMCSLFVESTQLLTFDKLHVRLFGLTLCFTYGYLVSFLWDHMILERNRVLLIFLKCAVACTQKLWKLDHILFSSSFIYLFILSSEDGKDPFFLSCFH